MPDPRSAGVMIEVVAPEPTDLARILVVDDDERNLLAIETVLQDVGEVVVARSGEEALRHLLKAEFAVILLDVYMPGMDGYETAQMIRSREQTRRIPIIFLSAVNKEVEHLIRGYAMGAVDYVFKPVEPVVLRSKVAVFVDLFSMRREIQRKAAQEQQLLDENLRANAERLKAEQDLRFAEQRQAAIIDSLPLILYLEPAQQALRMPNFVSSNFEAVTGFDFEQVRADPSLWSERLHPEDRDRVADLLLARRAGRSFAVEYRWRCADGEYRHFLDQAVLIRDAEGRPVEYAGTLLDVTERKELEVQLLHARKMDAIGKLTGGVAHDFNNLLAAVLGGLSMLERRVALDEEGQKVVGMTRHAAEQGVELVSRLMAFARKQKLKPARIDIDVLMRSVSDLLAHTLGGLVTLSWHVDSPLWQPYADEAQLELALMNLIINARDAMPDGGRITIAARNADPAEAAANGLASGDFVVIEVADKGAGIPPELLERVVEPFFTTKAVGKGTGLGLSMVYGFAEQSGGVVRLQSRIGVGTKVAVWLPRASELVPVQAAAPPADIALKLGRLRLLLVDDHPAVRETTAAMLVDMGHDVVVASHGQAAVDLLRGTDTQFDMLITDYAMPEMSGMELVLRCRDLRPSMPAIIVTGNADALETVSDVRTLIKPYTLTELGRVMAAVLSGAETAR